MNSEGGTSIRTDTVLEAMLEEFNDDFQELSYGIISEPLIELLKEDGLKWTSKAPATFENLKQAMLTAPILALPDFTKTFVIETDACDKEIGVVLMQEERPIAYLSKALGVKNLGLLVYEKEFLSLMLAVRKWKQYIQGHHFIIRRNQ
ncbi:UNVERIFIED_CONTAM: Transposon Tf2-11 polyprotein [Sesamum calycinum]|uniref:Transposon Tf2-11 polyprotein n=1 Tax=Sesamum calycinum TaxID=2727403 RepID=A0AAW2JTQ4_9LAMI